MAIRDCEIHPGQSFDDEKFGCARCHSAGIGAPPLKVESRYGAGKPELSLFPPDALIQAGEIMTHASHGKYAPHDWRIQPGQVSQTKHVDAALRHIVDYLKGHNVDEDSGKHPLAHALVRLAMAIQLEVDGAAIDDRFGGP